MPKGWFGTKPLEWKLKVSENNPGSKEYFKSFRVQRVENIIEQLKKNGVMSITDVDGYYPRLLMIDNQDKLIRLQINWAGAQRGATLKGSRFIKSEFLGKAFLGLKADRTSLVRFFTMIFRKDMKYKKGDAKAINQWLKNFKLSRAEKVAVITSLGYKYRWLEHMMIDGYLDNKPSHLLLEKKTTHGKRWRRANDYT